MELSARVAGAEFELAIQDHGRGFEVGKARAGVGLKSLRDRAAAAGRRLRYRFRAGGWHMRAAHRPSPLPLKMPHVWIIEDHPAFRRGTERALMAPPHRHAVRAFENCEDALAALAGSARPEVILLDIGLSGMDGIEGLAHLKSRAPAASILILTVFEDDDKIFRAICAGASGYLLKSQPVAQLSTAIEQALAGGSPMNPRIASRVLAMFAKLAPVKKDYGLTEREQQVLRCMADGLPRKQIPEAVGLNPHTADYVARNIYRKLHVNCAAAAVSIAVREGLLAETEPEGKTYASS